MNRQEFMRQLEFLLREIPVSDRQDAIAYYNDYFDEAGAENEAQVIRELGSPEKVAEMIKRDLNLHEFAGAGMQAEKTQESQGENYSSYNYANADLPAEKEAKKKNKFPTALLIILVIFASPLILGVGTGILGVVVGIIGALFGIFMAVVGCGIGFSIGGVACLVAGVVRVFTNPVEGFASMGAGGIMAALGVLCILLLVWCVGKWLPALLRWGVEVVQRLVFKKKGEV